VVPWLTTPGARIFPSGRLTSSRPATRARGGIRRLDQIRARPYLKIRSTIFLSGHSVVCGPGQLPQQTCSESVLRNPLQSMFNTSTWRLNPSHSVFETSRRHHPIVGYGGARVVQPAAKCRSRHRVSVRTPRQATRSPHRSGNTRSSCPGWRSKAPPPAGTPLRPSRLDALP